MTGLSLNMPLRARPVRRVFLALAAIGCSLFALMDPARAAPGQTSSPSVMDTCLPLLQSIRPIAPNSVTDRNQRTAGTTAALGLVMGIHFALTSPVTQDQKPLVRQRMPVPTAQTPAANTRALAIAAYRACRKDHALRALNVLPPKQKAAVS